jgi:hypothetical protein
MRRKRAGGNVADQIAAFIGKSMGDLVNRKEALQRELADVEKQIAGVRDRVVRQFGDPGSRRRTARRAVKRAKRVVSAASRRKMAAAAKRRWAKVKQAAKSATEKA